MDTQLYFTIVAFDPERRTVEVDWNNQLRLNHRLPKDLAEDAGMEEVVAALLRQTPREELGLVDRPPIPQAALEQLLELEIEFTPTDLDDLATFDLDLPEVDV